MAKNWLMALMLASAVTANAALPAPETSPYAELAPDLGEAHLVLANSLSEQLDFARASDE